MQRPYPVDWVSQVIWAYVREGLAGKAVDKVSVAGFYFHQRHNQEKESMKIRLAPTIDNVLYQVAKRLGTTQMMVLTQEIIYHFEDC